MWATATGKRLDCGSVQFGPMYISSPVDWTCEHYNQMDENLMTSNVGVTWDRVQNSACHGTLKGKQVKYGAAMFEKQI